MRKLIRAIWLGFVLILSVGMLAAMAEPVVTNAIKINVFLEVNNGDFELTKSVQNYRANQAGRSQQYAIQNVTTNPTSLIMHPDVAIGGYSYMRNLGTNDIIVTVDLLFKPSDVAVFRVAGTNIIVRTTNDISRQEYWVNEE